jgi:hypothetical protein
MAIQAGVPIVLSVPTSGAGATPAATYAFYTAGYRMPRRERMTTRDVIKNQNGLFIYRYDNGPGPRSWDPFDIVMSSKFRDLGEAATQLARLEFIWNYVGNVGMKAPEGIYTVNWSDAPLQPRFDSFPGQAGDKINYRVTVTFEEGG